MIVPVTRPAIDSGASYDLIYNRNVGKFKSLPVKEWHSDLLKIAWLFPSVFPDRGASSSKQ